MFSISTPISKEPLIIVREKMQNSYHSMIKFKKDVCWELLQPIVDLGGDLWAILIGHNFDTNVTLEISCCIYMLYDMKWRVLINYRLAFFKAKQGVFSWERDGTNVIYLSWIKSSNYLECSIHPSRKRRLYCHLFYFFLRPAQGKAD